MGIRPTRRRIIRFGAPETMLTGTRRRSRADIASATTCAGVWKRAPVVLVPLRAKNSELVGPGDTTITRNDESRSSCESASVKRITNDFAAACYP